MSRRKTNPKPTEPPKKAAAARKGSKPSPRPRTPQKAAQTPPKTADVEHLKPKDKTNPKAVVELENLLCVCCLIHRGEERRVAVLKDKTVEALDEGDGWVMTEKEYAKVAMLAKAGLLK